MRFTNVFDVIWRDEKFLSMTVNGRLLFLYLLTNPHTNMAGIYFLSPGYAQADLVWDSETFQKTMSEVLGTGMVLYDPKNMVVLIPKYLRYNKIENPDQAMGAVSRSLEYERSVVFKNFLDGISALDERVIGWFEDGFSRKGTESALIQLKESLKSVIRPSQEGVKRVSTSGTDIGIGTRPLLPDGNPSDLMKLWNETMTKLPKCIALSRQRLTKCRLRLSERSLKEWREIFNKINRTHFLIGENHGGWRATFDWIIANQENSLKVLEGKYDKDKPDRRQTGFAYENVSESPEHQAMVKQLVESTAKKLTKPKADPNGKKGD